MNMYSRMNWPNKGESKNSVGQPSQWLHEVECDNLQALWLARQIMTKEQRKEWIRRWRAFCKRPFKRMDMMVESGRN